MTRLAVLVLAACSGHSHPAPPLANNREPTPAAKDDLCGVMEVVRAAAAHDFAGIYDPNAPAADSGFVSSVKPADAEQATVADLGPVAGGWIWSTSLPGDQLPAERVAAVRARLRACAFGARLEATKMHASEKDGAPDAIEFTDPDAHVEIEVVAEGTRGVSITVGRR